MRLAWVQVYPGLQGLSCQEAFTLSRGHTLDMQGIHGIYRVEMGCTGYELDIWDTHGVFRVCIGYLVYTWGFQGMHRIFNVHMGYLGHTQSSQDILVLLIVRRELAHLLSHLLKAVNIGPESHFIRTSERQDIRLLTTALPASYKKLRLTSFPAAVKGSAGCREHR